MKSIVHWNLPNWTPNCCNTNINVAFNQLKSCWHFLFGFEINAKNQYSSIFHCCFHANSPWPKCTCGQGNFNHFWKTNFVHFELMFPCTFENKNNQRQWQSDFWLTVHMQIHHALGGSEWNRGKAFLHQKRVWHFVNWKATPLLLCSLVHFLQTLTHLKLAQFGWTWFTPWVHHWTLMDEWGSKLKSAQHNKQPCPPDMHAKSFNGEILTFFSAPSRQTQKFVSRPLSHTMSHTLTHHVQSRDLFSILPQFPCFCFYVGGLLDTKVSTSILPKKQVASHSNFVPCTSSFSRGNSVGPSEEAILHLQASLVDIPWELFFHETARSRDLRRWRTSPHCQTCPESYNGVSMIVWNRLQTSKRLRKCSW